MIVTPAMAQSTAGAYCATISGCEVIAINMPGMYYDTNQGSQGSGNVEYCRGNHYKVYSFYYLQANGSGSYNTTFIFRDTSGQSLNYTNKGLDATTLCSAASASGSGLNVLP